MKLLEYEAKQILKQFGVPVPQSAVLRPDENKHVALPVVLKSQVPVGGRGKAGGVVIVESEDDLTVQKEKLRHLSIKGFLPKVLLAEELISIKREHYLALLVDRSIGSIRLMAHKHGGIEVEDNTSESFFYKSINGASISDISKQAADFLGYNATQLEPFIQTLLQAFSESDATLLELNPLIVTTEDKLICGDCKMELDDAAYFRHPEWDFEDTPKATNFVILNNDGNVATIANGAGLAMATVDAVAASGMTPANFLDIGGGATTESVLAAFKKIQEFPNVQAIVINIFAGITRCDQIARAVIEAKQQLPQLPPVFIRLAGTNFEEAVALLAAVDIPTLGTLEDCLDAAREVVHG
ncbi:MAG TPA: succinate--CoA ligase subunit beta [Candidatus Saccharimonadales bacterium]|nr:succinate--CoA ligase subunit beta [Candidatus Saccharimonadales bacterium]